MNEMFKAQSVLCLSIVFFILYLFCTQWSVSALFADKMVARDILSIASNGAWIASLLASLYRLALNATCYTRRKFFVSVFVVAVILLAVVSKSPAVVLPFIIGLASLGVGSRLIAKWIVASIGALLVVSLVFSLLGLNGGDVASKPPFGLDASASTVATALGLSNPNAVMTMLVNVIVLGLFLCANRSSYVLTSVILSILVVGLGFATGSSTGLLIGMLSIILMFAYKYIVSDSIMDTKRVLRKATPYMFLVVTVLSLAVAVGYNPNNPGILNDLLTNRPYFWHLRVENGSYINLYGNNDEYEVDPASREDNQVNHYPLDNGPMYILVHYGFIIYIFYLYIFYQGSKRINNSDLLVYIFVACVASFSGRGTFLSFVYIFLVKAIIEYKFLRYTSERSVES